MLWLQSFVLVRNATGRAGTAALFAQLPREQYTLEYAIKKYNSYS